MQDKKTLVENPGLATVVRVGALRPHPDPETTQIGIYDAPDGRHVIVRLDTYKPGELAVYFRLGSILPDHPQFRFIWESEPRLVCSACGGARCQLCGQHWANCMFCLSHPGLAPVPWQSRRVARRNMRGVESEGLLQPVVDFMTLNDKPLLGVNPKEGDDVTDALRITALTPGMASAGWNEEQARYMVLTAHYPANATVNLPGLAEIADLEFGPLKVMEVPRAPRVTAKAITSGPDEGFLHLLTGKRES